MVFLVQCEAWLFNVCFYFMLSCMARTFFPSTIPIPKYFYLKIQLHFNVGESSLKTSCSYTLGTLSFSDSRYFLKYLYTVLYLAYICELCSQLSIFDEQRRGMSFEECFIKG